MRARGDIADDLLSDSVDDRNASARRPTDLTALETSHGRIPLGYCSGFFCWGRLVRRHSEGHPKQSSSRNGQMVPRDMYKQQ